jgi:outer membrane receptor protein involved in Fe transport
LFRLPGGDLKFALGYEHRNESTAFDPGAFYAGAPDADPTTDADGDGDPTNDRTQFGRSVVIQPVSGSYNTDEVFGELTAELLSPQNDVPGIYRLELHGAARYVNNSIAGNDWTWTVEGRYAPIRDVTFRANYTRAIRAPAITELFNPSSSFFTFATDPCDSTQLNNGPDPAARQANCASQGIPTDFQSRSDQASIRGGLAGNVQLENERSRAWSFGGVLTPRFIPNLRISADYLDVRLREAISQLGSSTVVANCYDAEDFPNNQFCDRVSRNLTGSPDVNDPNFNGNYGQLTFVETSFFNSAELRYKGILVALDYRVDTPFLGAGSRLGFNLNYQYLDSLTTRATATSAPSITDGTIGYPHHSAVLNMSYENGPYLFTTTLNYTGPVNQFSQEVPNFREFERLKGVVFVDMGLAVNVNDRMRLRFLVDNIFNTSPPFPVPAAGGSVSYFEGILGRFYRVGASISF